MIAQFAPVAVASPPSADHHEDMARSATTPTAGKATPASLPGPGTVVPSDGLTVAIAANPAEPGPVDVVVSIRRDDGVSVAGAHVAVLSEMAGMEQDGAETTAVETQPGEYVAARVPLSMSGEWRLAVCVSPNGELTHVVSFAAVAP